MNNEIEYQEGIENLREIASKTKTLIVLADIKQEINTLKDKVADHELVIKIKRK
jgi:hypothetical protein